jgi:aminocarboxymuconate-semialdehyde decarboxylase
MKLDVFSHILPAKYNRLLGQKAPKGFHLENLNRTLPTITNLDDRFRLMDKYDDYKQVLTISSPAVESIVGPEDAVALSKLANDELADLVAKHPDRFVAGVATLPMNDVDSALDELDRSISELNLKGILLYTPINDKPLSSPEFLSIYKKMVEYDLPIWIHPHRTHMTPDYAREKMSKYLIYSTFGWPYETTAAMARLVFSAILFLVQNECYPVQICPMMQRRGIF